MLCFRRGNLKSNCTTSNKIFSRGFSRAIEDLCLQSNWCPTTYLLLQFAVICEACSNTGIDRMDIINVVAKSVPRPHKGDLSNPNKTIVAEIVKACEFTLTWKVVLL